MRADLRELRGGARGALLRLHVRARRARVRGARRTTLRRDRGRRSPPQARGSRPTPGARRRRATSAAGRCRARLFLLNALLGAVATRGRHVPERLEQVRATADSTRRRIRRPGTSSPGRVEYPLAMNELSFLLPHFLQGGARHARRVLHARLQPGLDEPRRLLLDRGAHRRGADRPARRADADLERDRLLRRLRAAGRARLRAPRSPLLRAVRRPVDRLPPARAARRPRTARAGRSPTRGR